jgi:hypothetical protein
MLGICYGGFLVGRGLESRIKNFLAKKTFSKQVLQWWINLQQQHIARGQDSCQTWKCMKLVLQRQFDPPIEHHVPKINKIAMTSKNHSFGTKSNVCSSWSDSIIGEVLPTHSYGNKSVATHSQTCHGSEQKLKPSTCGIVQNKKSLDARNFSSPRKKSHVVYTKKYFPCKEDTNTYSTASIDVQHNNSSQSAELSCRHVEQVVQISCDASTKPVVLIVDDASNGVSMLAREVQHDGIATCTKGQRSSIF